MATFPVKYINNAMRGAPVLNGQAGTLIGVLDAFLITGFGTVTALSVTVAGGIATATVQAGNSFNKGCIVWVDGATPAVLNGEQRVLTASSTSITFATTAPDGPATGTITIKVAPVGQWEKKFSGTNKAVYRSTDAAGSGFCLRVDDTGTTTARVVGYETMSDVDTGVGPFPTAAQVAGGGYVHKSASANATSVKYTLFADSRMIYWCASPGTSISTSPDYESANVRGFGDPIALAPGGDAWAAIMSTDPLSFGSQGALSGGPTLYSALAMARSFGGIGGSVLGYARPYTGAINIESGLDMSVFGSGPSGVDGSLRMSKMFVLQGSVTTGHPRADLPGIWYLPYNNARDFLSPGDVVQGVDGRDLYAVSTGGGLNSTYRGIVLIDITGPWR